MIEILAAFIRLSNSINFYHPVGVTLPATYCITTYCGFIDSKELPAVRRVVLLVITN